MKAIEVSNAPWEIERHLRGSVRWYPIDGGTVPLQIGAASGGSATTYSAPGAILTTAGATATPQNRAREAVEKQGPALGTPIWSVYDTSIYWARTMRIQAHTVCTVYNITPAGGTARWGIFLGQVGVINAAPGPIWVEPATFPRCILYAERPSIIDGGPEVWKLHTAPGDGVTASLVTTLVGVNGPAGPAAPGGAKCQRAEIVYKPGEYVAALVDGIEGARHTTNLPDPTFAPSGSASLAGIGVWLDNCQLNDNVAAAFLSLMLETYRP